MRCCVVHSKLDCLYDDGGVPGWLASMASRGVYNSSVFFKISRRPSEMKDHISTLL